MSAVRRYLLARKALREAAEAAPEQVIVRLLSGWEPSRGRSNVGRWWRSMDPETRKDRYELMLPSEAAVIDAAYGRIGDR